MGFDVPNDREVFITNIRVRFYELDPYDHVNHTNYFSYFETARIDMLSEVGWGMDVMKEKGIQKVVVDMEARFKAAARFNEELVIHTWVEDIGRARTHWRQLMTRADDEIARLRASAAFTDPTGRPIRVPEEFRSRFST